MQKISISLKWTWIIAILASLLVATVGIASAAGGSSLISLWQANGDALDSVGGNDGTLLPVVGGTTFATGVDDQAFSFDGVNDLVLIDDDPSLNPTTAITLAAWVRVTGKEGLDRDIVSKDGESSNRQYLLTASSVNKFRAHLGFFPTPTSTGCLTNAEFRYFDGGTTVNLNQWYHVAMTYDGSTLKLYVDGALDGSCSVSGAMLTTTQPVRIGGGAPGGAQNHFQGLIDNAQIYDSALTAKEVRKLYKQFSVTVTQKCKGSWDSTFGGHALAWLDSTGAFIPDEATAFQALPVCGDETVELSVAVPSNAAFSLITTSSSTPNVFALCQIRTAYDGGKIKNECKVKGETGEKEDKQKIEAKNKIEIK